MGLRKATLHLETLRLERTLQSLIRDYCVEDQSLADSEHVMRELESTLCEKFAIGHTTVQVEFCHPCTGEADHLAEHNHPHAKLARLATSARRRTPLSRRAPAHTTM